MVGSPDGFGAGADSAAGATSSNRAPHPMQNRA